MAGIRWFVRLTDGPQVLLVLAMVVLTSINIADPSSRVQGWAVVAVLVGGGLAIVRSVVLRPYVDVLYDKGVLGSEFKGLRLFGMIWLLVFAGLGGTYAAADLGSSVFAPETVSAVVGSCRIEDVPGGSGEDNKARFCRGTWKVDGRSYQGRLPTTAPEGATVTVRINKDHPEEALGEGSVVRGGAGGLLALASLAFWVRLWGLRVLALRRHALGMTGGFRRRR